MPAAESAILKLLPSVFAVQTLKYEILEVKMAGNNINKKESSGIFCPR